MQGGGQTYLNTHEDYKTLEKVGEGAFGSVFRAVDRATGLEVALKQIRIREGRVGPAMRELNALRQLDHPNVIALFGSHTHGSNLVIAMPCASPHPKADRTPHPCARRPAAARLPTIRALRLPQVRANLARRAARAARHASARGAGGHARAHAALWHLRHPRRGLAAPRHQAVRLAGTPPNRAGARPARLCTSRRRACRRSRAGAAGVLNPGRCGVALAVCGVAIVRSADRREYAPQGRVPVCVPHLVCRCGRVVAG